MRTTGTSKDAIATFVVLRQHRQERITTPQVSLRVRSLGESLPGCSGRFNRQVSLDGSARLVDVDTSIRPWSSGPSPAEPHGRSARYQLMSGCRSARDLR